MAKGSLADRLDRIIAEMFAAEHGAGRTTCGICRGRVFGNV